MRTETARRLTLAFTLRDGLVPLPLRLALRPEGTLHCLVTGRVVARFPPEWIVGDAAGALAHGEASGAGETRIVLEVPAGPEGLRFELVLAEGPPVSTDASDRHVDVGMARPAGPFGPDLDFRLPDPVWEAKVRALLDQAALFFLAGDRVPYGLYPSVYDGDVFGLEEDWLFFGLALWGQGDAARRAFRRTYLNDQNRYMKDDWVYESDDDVGEDIGALEEEDLTQVIAATSTTVAAGEGGAAAVAAGGEKKDDKKDEGDKK